MTVMMNGKEKLMDKFNSQFVSTINDAILKQKFRIIKRMIVDNVDSFNGASYKMEYAIQIGHKFLFWHFWTYAEHDNNGMAIWHNNIEYCKKWIYNKYVYWDNKIEIVGLLPSE